MSNLRCFAQADIEFPAPTGEPLSNIVLIVGDNGSGKSTVLKAVALAVLGGALASAGFRPYYLVRRRKLNGGKGRGSLSVMARLRIHETYIHASTQLKSVGTEDVIDVKGCGFSFGDNSKLKIPDELFLPDDPSFFLCGYGSKRNVEEGLAYNPVDREKSRSARFQRVASLFEERAPLRPFSAWLSQLTAPKDGVLSPHHDEALEIVNSLLEGSGIRWTRGIVNGEASFINIDGSTVPFPALSDGFRAFLSWVGDLLHHLCAVTPEGTRLTELKGIVLIDEIDAFLHPSWQLRVLRQLSQALPCMQFILTTHSPILSGCVARPNLFVCESHENGASIRLSNESIYGRTVEEILLSSYFGLRSTRAPDADEARQALLEQQETAARKLLERGDQQSAKEYLQTLEIRLD